MRPVPASVDAYMAGIESDVFREALSHLRKIILEEVPDAEEVIAYGIPSYKRYGMVTSFAAFKKHCSFFPGMATQDFLDELRDFKTSTGTIQFTPETPIPDDLVRRILRHRVAMNEAKHLKKS